MQENTEEKRTPSNFTCKSHKNDSKTLGEERGLKGAVSALVRKGEGLCLGEEMLLADCMDLGLLFILVRFGFRHWLGKHPSLWMWSRACMKH